ncbi:MAG TPA: flagellar hook-basal body complex protein [Acetobacteraceae bacterium]|nr:flagellar hook-basal body complex protein [Acetobacteraceae bacterium]
MLGAIYIGMSGMDAYEKGLQTISNNVANLNTLGFKATEVSFTDLFDYGGQGEMLGSNAGSWQSGNGVSYGTPFIDFSQGTLNQTSQGLDLAIQGGGFLMLLGGAQPVYARTGSFKVDDQGFISLQGSDRHLAVIGPDGKPEAVNVSAKRTSPPKATTTITFSDNLSSSATDATVSNLSVYDSNGVKQTWTVKFTRNQSSGVTGNWAVQVTDSTGRTVGTSTLNFIGGTIDPTTTKLVINDTPAGADPLAVTLDFSSGVTSFSSGTTSTIQATAVDGNGPGDLSDVAVDENGQIKLTYSNGKTDLEGAVAVADFRDPQQLQRIGNGIYTHNGTEQVTLRASNTAGVGTVVSKQLETSNVDLSKEFGDLILVQRGYQASSQVVSVANDMIQQLFGIRGQ